MPGENGVSHAMLQLSVPWVLSRGQRALKQVHYLSLPPEEVPVPRAVVGAVLTASKKVTAYQWDDEEPLELLCRYPTLSVHFPL
jgi:hypothetical protein